MKDDLGDHGENVRTLSPGIKPLLVLSKIRGILDSFTLAKPLMSLADLRASTGYPTSTVQRLVANLVAEGFLDREGDRYTIGVNFAYWAATAARRLNLVEAAMPILQRLRDETGETAALFRAERMYQVCVAMADTRHALRRELHVGKLLPLHTGSSGRVLLAGDEALLEKILSGPLERFTPWTVVDPDKLRTYVTSAKRDGYVVTRDEQDEGATGISVPVKGINSAVIGAISIIGPTVRISEDTLQDWVDPLVQGAEELRRLAGQRGRPSRGSRGRRVP